jgi:hypothetical protein
MQSSETDNKLFYKLIARQRNTKSASTLKLVVNDTVFEGDSQIGTGWQEYFADLATPKPNPKYDPTYIQLAETANNTIRQNSNQDSKIIPVTETEVQYYISKLNNGKAADEGGLTAEHLKYAGSTVYGALAHIITAAANLSYIPPSLKSGVLTPVHKKGGKPLDDPGSYRGITVCSMLSKVVEQFIATHTETLLRPYQCDLQYGFTQGMSPTHAALLVTEAIAEQRDTKVPLYVATLDAQKAFDVVNHESLMWKWHERGLRGALWHLKDTSYTNMPTKVKWKGLLSQPFKIKQGVRQGGIPSTTDYKLYVDPLLNDLESGKMGLYIGSTNIGNPTCADDIILLTESAYSLQHMLTTAELYASKEQYTIHPTKSVVSVYNSGISNESWNELSPWILYKQPMPVEPVTTHLGVTRTAEKAATVSPFIMERLKTGRRTVYALMGAGLHGLNGLSPVTCLKIYTTYVLPRLISSVETVTLNQNEKNSLETFHRSILRQIQHLPQRTATPAIYLLLGTLPIQAEIDKRKLTLFGSIARDKTSTLCNIAKRQLTMKSLDSKSWFSDLVEISYQYGLPSPHEILESPPSRGKWKSEITSAINYYWGSSLKSVATTKSSLRYLSTQNFHKSEIGTHPLWTSVELSTRDIQRACYQLKMATGTYMLQTHRNIYSKNKEKATCPLCTTGAPEDYQHFIGECPDSATDRQWFLHKTNIPNSPPLITQAALDPTSLVSTYGDELYTFSRIYCFKLHHNRALRLGYRPYPGARIHKLSPHTSGVPMGGGSQVASSDSGGVEAVVVDKRVDLRTGGTDRVGGGMSRVGGGTVTVTGHHARCSTDWRTYR